MNKKNGLTRNIISSLFLLAICFTTQAQGGTKKYVRRNKKAPIIQYGDSAIYARGLYNDSTRLFIGNSDGSIYYLNLEDEKSQLILKLPNVNEIRDIERSGDQLIAMHSGENGELVLIKLSGEMNHIHPEEWKGVFLDGVDIKDQRGFMMGDPVNGFFSLYHSNDGGNNWSNCEGAIEAQEGEAGYAASGTNVQVLNDSTYVFVSGGEVSRFFKSTDNGKSWSKRVLPYYPGESTGPYSMCFANDSSGVLVGGDYKDPDLGMNTCFYTNDGGESWLNAMETVRGYRSCVYFTQGVYYACGRNGIDFSLNGGKDWSAFADGPYFSLTSTKTHLIATTRHGSIQIFELLDQVK